MIEEPPNFRIGNRSIADALNEVGNYAMRHGVHAAGVPGWNQTPHGWKPPFSSAASGLGPREWDLLGVSDEESENTHELFRPNAFSYSEAPVLPVSIPVNNAAFVAIPNSWVVARISSLTAVEIEIAVIGNEAMEKVYYFDESNVFQKADLPLYRLYAEESPNRDQVSEGIFAERIIASGPKRLSFALIRVGDVFRSVPELV